MSCWNFRKLKDFGRIFEKIHDFYQMLGKSCQIVFNLMTVSICGTEFGPSKCVWKCFLRSEMLFINVYWHLQCSQSDASMSRRYENGIGALRAQMTKTCKILVRSGQGSFKNNGKSMNFSRKSCLMWYDMTL